jgi:hypothetical protein
MERMYFSASTGRSWKKRLRLGEKKKWCIPTVGAEFVWRIEDVLDMCTAPYDPQKSQVCFDEHLAQLIAEIHRPLPPKPGRPERFDYEYKRDGTHNLFLFCQPLAGWRHIKVGCNTQYVFCAHRAAGAKRPTL